MRPASAATGDGLAGFSAASDLRECFPPFSRAASGGEEMGGSSSFPFSSAGRHENEKWWWCGDGGSRRRRWSEAENRRAADGGGCAVGLQAAKVAGQGGVRGRGKCSLPSFLQWCPSCLNSRLRRRTDSRCVTRSEGKKNLFYGAGAPDRVGGGERG